MNRQLSLVFVACMLLLFGLSSCKNKVNVAPLEETVKDAIAVDSINIDSIETDSVTTPPSEYVAGEESLFDMNLTADTIIKTNRELVTLMDELYRYVRSKIYFSEKTNIDKNFQWMSNYRKKLCQYYDSHKLGPMNISIYAKADSVMEEIRRLWNIDMDNSTMGWIVYSSIKNTRQEFQLYNDISYMCSLCDNEDQQNLLRKSFEEGLMLQSILRKIGSNFAAFEFWGGSYAGMACSDMVTAVYTTFLQFYGSEMNLLKSHFVKDINLEGQIATAKKRLIDACPKVFDKCCEGLNEKDWEESEESLKYYRQDKKDTQRLIASLPNVLDKWIKTLEDFSEAVYPPKLRKYSKQNTIDCLNKITRLYNSVPDCYFNGLDTPDEERHG